ncbi:MAG: hypothetical protein EPO08_03465 [Rhodospirillaceae bacterium]|nr:MAG: hypothetical protein EPO08_03465 [Rhodospirillaceae bacterium]
MTRYTLMSGQTVPSNAPNAPVPAQVVLAGNPKRAKVTFSLGQPTGLYAAASLWAQTAITPYGYTQNVPLLSLALLAGEDTVAQDMQLDLSYYNFLYGQLDLIDASQSVAATLAMDV